MKKLIPVALLGIAACTQAPVSVVFKGDEIFGRNSQATSSAYNSNPYHSSFEIRSEGTAEPQRVGTVGVAELPPLKGISQEQAFNDYTQPQGRMMPAAPQMGYQPAVQQIELPAQQQPYFTPTAVRVESPSGSSDVREDWYQGKVVLAKADVGSIQPASQQSTETPAMHNQFIWPVRGKVISHFGPKANGLHNDGINIAANYGDPFYSAADGVVVYSGSGLKGYGNMVIIRHAEGWMTAYAHAEKLLVKQNERVRQGQQIGIVGATGSVNEAQLHFGLRQGKSPVDPAKYLGSDYAAR